jgi:hypothetical protein
MRRGLCYQTLRDINQTEADDIGRLVLEIKAPPSITSPQYNYIQPQVPEETILHKLKILLIILISLINQIKLKLKFE